VKWSTKQKQAALIESMMNRYPFLQMSSRAAATP
jgi:hypothetical protein